jgi:hypothetical protein
MKFLTKLNWLLTLVVQYKLMDRYLLTGTIRRDGSSNFGNYRWGTFPAFGVGWVLSKEDFIANVKESIY